MDSFDWIKLINLDDHKKLIKQYIFFYFFKFHLRKRKIIEKRKSDVKRGNKDVTGSIVSYTSDIIQYNATMEQ